MEATLNKESVTFQGHHYQIFQYLSQMTFWPSPKEKLLYETSFAHPTTPPHCILLELFSIRFSHKGTSYAYKSTEDLITTLWDLHLSTPKATSEGSKGWMASCSPKKLQASPDHQAQSSVHKQGRFASPAPEDPMDWLFSTGWCPTLSIYPSTTLTQQIHKWHHLL